MSIIHWDEDNVTLKTFSISGTNGKTSVKIELVTTDGYSAGRLIYQLQESKAKQTRPRRPVSPSEPYRSAIARPMPRAAPVISATLFSSVVIICFPSKDFPERWRYPGCICHPAKSICGHGQS